jgi:MFS family permease
MTRFLGRIYAFKFLDAFILIFPLYVVMFVDAGLTPVQISACLIAWSAVTFVLQVPSGVIADRASRRLVLALAQLGRAAGFGIWLADPHFWGFLVGLLLWGVKSAFTSGTFEALLYDELKARGAEADYTRIFGRSRAVQAIAVLCAALGAAAVVRHGYGLALGASLAASLLAVVAALALPPAPPAVSAGDSDYLGHLRAGMALSFRQPRVLDILVFSALVLALGAALEEFWPVFGAKVGLTRSVIALFVCAQNAVEAVVSALAHRLAAWPAWAFHALFALAGAVLVGAAVWFAPSAMALLALYSGMMKLVAIVFEGRLQVLVPSGQRATIGSVKGFLAQIGLVGLYAGFGPAAQATSYRIAFMACGVVALAVGLGYLAAARANPRRGGG